MCYQGPELACMELLALQMYRSMTMYAKGLFVCKRYCKSRVDVKSLIKLKVL